MRDLNSRLKNFLMMALISAGAGGGFDLARSAVIERGSNETTAAIAGVVGLIWGAMGFYTVGGILGLLETEKPRR
jgi:hypothetical protein